MKKALRLVLKIVIITGAAVLALVVVGILGLNAAKYAVYSEYYGIKTDICKNPGLYDGFVCQGVAVSDKTGHFLVSGYMKDGGASRIYVTMPDTDDYFVELEQNGKAFDGHVGGIAITNDSVYIADGGKIYTVDISDILGASEGTKVDVGEGIEVNNKASFVYTDEEYLYVGEFHNGAEYNIEGHENQTAEGTHYAICTKYSIDNLNTPIKVYSIRNKVQGICFTPEGNVIMSTSYGLADTVYYVYNEADATASGKEFDGAPLYYLDTLVSEMKGPAMGEDLDYYDGRVITLTESASDKYIFGKLFGADKIVGLDF